MGYAEERLDLIARLRRQLPGRSLADALRLDGRALRFHLGTSLADLRVPICIDDSIRDTLQAAVRDLFFLLSMRHRLQLRENEYDRLILLDGFDPKSARTVSFIAPASVKSENVRNAFLEAPELHPALDGGLVASWLTTGRQGRVLAGALTVLLKRAMAEGAAQEPVEPTPYIVLLALRTLSQAALDVLRDLPVSGPAGRALNGAVAAGLLTAVRLAARESGVLSGAAGLQCEAALSPLQWLGGIKMLFGSGLAAYGVPFVETPAKLDLLTQKILQGGTPETVERDAAGELGAKEAFKKAARQVALHKLRMDLLALLRMGEIGRAPSLSIENLTGAALFQAPGGLEKILAAPSTRKELEKRARSAAKGATNEQARAALESIAVAAREWKDEDPGAYVQQDAVMKAWCAAVAALAVDASLDRALDQAEVQLTPRTGAEMEGGIEREHEAGKLYFFSIEDKPILMGRSRSPQMGHLFCDMKDFTKRTAFLKETVVADFLSREFYGPILTAAARHARGAAHLADKGGIYLNNLLGDAVSFSGDIVALLELADDIRRALGSYARRLDSEGSREAVAKTISGIEERFATRHGQLAAAMKSAQDALRRGTLDPLSGEEPGTRLRTLEQEQHRLQDEREAEVALATGEKLEAGIFISYGAAPEVATFEDHIFGQIKVSIAEKINESARGTARNGGVRARVDALLQAERARLGKPGLICPLQVVVSQPLSMPLGAEAEMTVRRCIAGGDLAAAEAVLSGTVRDFVARLAAQDLGEDRGDIYNGGAAVSEEALKAYVDARQNDFIFVRRDIEVASLHPALREKFAFPMPALKLVLAMSASAQALQELFVFVGRALFKGFEKQGGLGVYEMVPRENPFFILLAQHHAAEWLAEHEQGLAPQTGEWRPVLLGSGT
ncbi:MAG TPA: hypothetical protein VLW85_12435 [Myxococcales bacterium]|nr:hypothetical protein [Myxococcales bacterium]